MIKLNSSILRRLALLQHIADKNKPAVVVVTLTSGNTIVTDSAGAVDLFQRMGPHKEIDRFQSDNPVYSGWARLLTVLLRPAPNRAIEDFE